MSREYIARALKRLREATGLKADDVGNMIGKSGKTVNAWENGRGQPDAEMLIKLCGIYKVDNMLAEFDETNSIGSNSVFSQKEVSIIKKYRTLDNYGKKAVDAVLSSEKETFQVISSYLQLDTLDRGRVIGRIENMLEADKYAAEKESLDEKAM